MRFDLVADAEQAGNGITVGVGMGHAHRCLALKESLRKKGVSTRLFLPDPKFVERIFSHPDAEVGSWQDLWQESLGQAETHEPREMLIVDSYRLATLPAGVRQRYKQIACFHDDKPPPAFASIAICCDLSTKNCERSSARYNSSAHSLCGGQYFPFHDRFARVASEATEKDRGSVLLWLGGKETGENLVPLLAEDVLGAWRAEVVVSPVVKPCADLLDLARPGAGREQAGRVRVHHDAAAMDALLPRCDIYLGGAGVAACEAALLGLQLILCPVAKNQRGNARALEQAGATLLPPPLLPNRVRAALRALEQERQSPLDLAPLDLASVGLDRKGAERLAHALLERVAS